MDFWKLEEFWVFLDFEQIPRVSKIPNLGVDFLDFWNFGNSRNLLDFWILRLPLEFPKIQTFGVGFLETGFLIRVFQGFLYDSLLCFRLPIKFNNTPVHFDGVLI